MSAGVQTVVQSIGRALCAVLVVDLDWLDVVACPPAGWQPHDERSWTAADEAQEEHVLASVGMQQRAGT